PLTTCLSTLSLHDALPIWRIRLPQQALSRLGPGRGAARAAAGLSQGSYCSITSSARASSDGGTVRPIAVAVLRLTTSSNLVGCSDRKSTRLNSSHVKISYA